MNPKTNVASGTVIGQVQPLAGLTLQVLQLAGSGQFLSSLLPICLKDDQLDQL